MAEQIVNGAQTTLAAPMLAGDLSLTVTSALGFPTTGNFSLNIQDASGGTHVEIVEVTAVSGTTWTVSRAAEAWSGVQTALAHAVGSLVTFVVTVRSVGALFDAAGSAAAAQAASQPVDSTLTALSGAGATGTGAVARAASPTFSGVATLPAVESAEFDNGNSGTSKAIAWNNGNFQKVTVTGVCTFSFTAPTSPGRFQLRIVQNATGYSITMPTIKWPGGSAATFSTAANSIDILTLYYDGANYYGVANTAFA